MLSTKQAYSHLRPRNKGRKLRQPGAHLRHSSQRQRFATNEQPHEQPTTPRPASAMQSSSYHMASGVEYNRNSNPNVPQSQYPEQEQTITHYKDLSTIEAIREDMKTIQKSRPESAPPNIPNWLLELDINLNVSSVDIVPPFIEEFERNKSLERVTFSKKPELTFIDDEAWYIESRSNSSVINNSIKVEEDYIEHTNEERHHVLENTHVISGRQSPSRSVRNFSSPRRYQGDKKVMSLQQGGIRSTPFQPKAKKYINQMISYNHMKHHDQKMRKAKAAVDTQMPSTFKIALERKRLVEQRLSSEWNRSTGSPSPSQSSTSLQKSTTKTR